MEELVDVIQKSDLEKLKQGLEAKKYQQYLHRAILEGEFALHLAAKNRNVQMVQALLEAGANVNQGSETSGSHRGYTAAHEAASNGDQDMLEVLNNFHADFNRCSNDQWYPLHCAVYKGKLSAISYLLEHGADINCQTIHHQTPLCFAVSHGRTRDVRLLLKKKARIDIQDATGDTLFHHALHFRMSKLFEGDYEIPESQIDVSVILALNGVNPTTLNTERENAFVFIQEDMPHFEKALTIIYNFASLFNQIPIEWNYMSFVTSKLESLVSCGVPPDSAHELFETLQVLEKEREESKARRQAERPQGGCPVMRGKRSKRGDVTKDSAAAESTAADPSGGKCPFFQKKEGESSSATELPSGHPPVPQEMLNANGSDPSGGKCPFFQKSTAVPRNEMKAELPPVCPFSIEFLKRHTSFFLFVAFAFVLGMWTDQCVNRYFDSKKHY